jgi:hypothetical protein
VRNLLLRLADLQQQHDTTLSRSILRALNGTRHGPTAATCSPLPADGAAVMPAGGAGLVQLPQHWLHQLLPASEDAAAPAGAKDVESQRLALLAQAILDACTGCCVTELGTYVMTQEPGSSVSSQGSIRLADKMRLVLTEKRAMSAGGGDNARGAAERGQALPRPTDVLLSICDGRLLPTPWLDKVANTVTQVTCVGALI